MRILVARGSVVTRVISTRLVPVGPGSERVSIKVLMMILVACGCVKVKVISIRLVSVEAASVVVRSSLEKSVVLTSGKTDVWVM